MSRIINYLIALAVTSFSSVYAVKSGPNFSDEIPQLVISEVHPDLTYKEVIDSIEVAKQNYAYLLNATTTTTTTILPY